MSLDDVLSDYPTITGQFGQGWLLEQFKLPREQKSLITLYLEVAAKEKPIIKEIQEELKTAEGQAKTNALMQLEFFSGSVGSVDLLESCLKELENEPNLPTLVKELHANDEKFYSALTVANLACYFKERGTLSLYPKIQLASKTKIPDLSVNLSGRPIWVEATTPGLAKAMLDHEGQVVGLKERALGQINDEFTENFAEAIAERKIVSDPIIIALDCGRSEIDQVSVDAALFGKQYLQFLVDNKDHKVVDERVLRKEPGIKAVEGMEMISGVLYSKRAQRKDGQLVISGALTLNPYAKNALDEAEYSKMDIVEVY